MTAKTKEGLTSSSGGKLILFELTTPDSIWAGFVFGILPGWWLGRCILIIATS
jgi:hypothetical protein